jgi:hypothetical protein
MSADIIQFPNQEQKRSNQQQREAELRVEREALIERVRLAATNGEKFERDEEIAPAQAVNRLIAEAKERKITQRLLADHLTKRHVATRHLERLRADHTLARSEAIKKADENLVKKIKPYVLVLDALADALRQSPNDILFDAFRETSFWRGAISQSSAAPHHKPARS